MLKLTKKKTRWDLTDIISQFGNEAVCDWENGPFLCKENDALFKTVIEMAHTLVMDNSHLKRFGDEGRKKLLNCLIDITLLSVSESEFKNDEEMSNIVIELTTCIYQLLTCRYYTPSLQDWTFNTNDFKEAVNE